MSDSQASAQPVAPARGASPRSGARGADVPGRPQDTHARAVRAARTLIAVRGLDVSMDEVAEASGISRRTLFRHFSNREALIVAALDEGFATYEGRFLVALQPGAALTDWIAGVLRQIHRTHLRAGRGLWHLACAFDDELSPALRAANRRRRLMRERITREFADRAWQLADGPGSAPALLVDTVATVLSSFTTHSLVVDRQRGVDEVVAQSVRILMAVLASLRPAGSPPPALDAP